jgi:hypothetical protein
MAPCMSSILALSVSDKIDQYGAYAGFASVVGLAVLSLLYFAQAREVKRLREWAGRAPERAADLQERAAAAAQQQRIVAPRPVPTTPGAPVTPAVPGARPAAATPAGQAQAVPGAAAAAATAAGAATATPPGAAVAPGQATSVQPAANGAPAATPPVPSVPPGQPLRVGGATGVPPRNPVASPDAGGGDRSPLAIAGAVGAIAIVAVAAVLLATGAFSGGDSNQPKNTIGTPGASATETTTTKSPGSSSTSSTATPKPGSYTVSVLNGTAVPGLARGVAIRLQNAKFKIGNVTNASDQTRSATQVEFAPGHRAEADTVAKAIDVAGDAIVPLTGASKTIAGEKATVVVTVGADQNTSPQQPGTTTG